MRRRTTRLLWLALGLTACGGGQTHVDDHHEATTPAAHDDGLASRLHEIASSLASASIVARGEVERGFLAGGEQRTLEVTVSAGRCTAFVSLASPGLHDLDATLFAPDGTELASDTEPDAHPTVVACADAAPRRAFLHLRAYAGAGAYVIAAFDGDLRALPALARVVGGHPGIAQAEGAASEQASRVRDFVLGAGRRGFEPRGDPDDVSLAAGQALRMPLPVEAHTCVTVGAFANGELANVDLRILDEEGGEVARDVSDSRDASAQACATRHAEWTVELVAARGQGSASVQVLSGPETRSGTASALWLGERTAARPASAAPPAPPSGALLAVSGTLAPGETVGQVMTLPRDACARVVATPGRGLVGLGITVRGGRAHDPPGGGAPTVVHLCGGSGPLELAVSARGGSGAYALTVTAVPPPAGIAPGLAAAVLDADADALAAGLSRDEVRPAGAAWQVAVPLGRCARLVRLAPAATVAAHVALVDGSHVVAEDDGISPRASACATAGAARTLQARSDPGPGAIAVVYRSAR